MKKGINITLIFFLIFSTSAITAQNFIEFSESLKKGNVNEIFNHLDDKVEVSILDEDSYSKSEAEDLLASFFTNGSANIYKAIHKGSALNESYYQIGELKTKNDTYRTYMYSKKMDGDYKIQEFRIEK